MATPPPVWRPASSPAMACLRRRDATVTIYNCRNYPRSAGEFQAWFRTDADCLDYLDWLRWPDGFACPECGQAGGWALGDARYKCAACGSTRAADDLPRIGTPPHAGSPWQTTGQMTVHGGRQRRISALQQADPRHTVRRTHNPPVLGSRASRNSRRMQRRRLAELVRDRHPSRESPSHD